MGHGSGRRVLETESAFKETESVFEETYLWRLRVTRELEPMLV